MGTERTPPLSVEGSREVEEEMRRPPADTPERRATFARMREMQELLRRNKPPNVRATGSCPNSDASLSSNEENPCAAPNPPRR